MNITIPYAMFVGIDIGSEQLVTFIRVVSPLSKALDQKPTSFTQTKKGYRTLAHALRKYAKQFDISTDAILVIMEATSNYWLPPATYLYRDGFDIMVINPSSARHYAGMKLKRSKSDPIDAKVLASLGLIYAVDDNIRIRLWHEPPPIFDELQQRVKLFTY